MLGRSLRTRALGLFAGRALTAVGVAGILGWAVIDGVRSATALPSGGAAITPAGFEDAILLTSAVGAWFVIGWLLAGVLATALASRPGELGRRARGISLVIAPAFVRRLTAAVLGAAIVATPVGAAGSASAAATPPVAPAAVTRVGGTDSPGHVELRGPGGRRSAASGPLSLESQRPLGPTAVLEPALATGAGPSLPELSPAKSAPPVPSAPGLTTWTPDRPAAPVKAQADPGAVRLVTSAPNPEQAVADEVVVRRGDTLWDIVARRLGPDSTAAEVAVEWPRWHAANRDVIGPDPGLILPGQLLIAPS